MCELAVLDHAPARRVRAHPAVNAARVANYARSVRIASIKFAEHVQSRMLDND